MNLHDFISRLSDLADDDGIFLGDAGNAMFATAQAIKLRGQQRLLLSGGQSCMGWALPAGIGAALATKHRVYVINGDGSVMMNLQELQTLKALHLPVKVFILNNGGYKCIESTQTRLCGSRWVGVSASTGLTLPSFCLVAHAFDLPHYRLTELDQLPDALAISGPAVCEVML